MGQKPQSSCADPGTLLEDGCWLAAESRRRGHRTTTEEGRGWASACQGRGRSAGGTWVRDAWAWEEVERLQAEKERKKKVVVSVLLRLKKYIFEPRPTRLLLALS